MAIQPKNLNETNKRFGEKMATQSWEAGLTLAFGDGRLPGLKNRLDSGNYSLLIKEAKGRLKEFKSIQSLENMWETDLASFYFLGVAYYKRGEIENAIGCFHIVYAQISFEKYMLKHPVDFSKYPETAGEYLNEIAGEYGEDSVKNFDVDSFLRNLIGKGSGCFIATAVYGDEFSKDVMTLKLFRDEYLTQHQLGKAFVKLYYVTSPSIANYISKKAFLKIVLRKYIIQPSVNLINKYLDK